MNLEPIIHSEVSQKEKDKHRLLTHLYENLERQYLMNLSEGQKWRCREQTCRHTGGRIGWDELRKQHGNIYMTTCKIR